jgi:hypothetical protein
VTVRVGDALAVCAERLGTDATGVLARLAGAVGEEARAAAAELAAVDDRERRQRRAVFSAEARATGAQALRAVHPSWIEAALAGLPERARAATAGSQWEPIDVWLARFATASLPPMPAVARRPLDQVLVRPAPHVLAWLSSVGADQLAFALGAAASSHPLLAAAAARIARSPRTGQLGPQRAAITRCRGVSLDEGERALVVVAGRALAPHLAVDPVGRLQLTRRLPRALGILVENELLAHASIALDQAPSTAALFAE